jgi:glycine/D-amino acid oxidase-like deaminating enzyme
MMPPILIIGQGLAGTALAWHCYWRRIDFLIVDADEAVTSSKVAAGMVTPITGLRLNLSWKFDECYGVMIDFYHKVESSLNKKYYFSKKVVTLFRDAKQQKRWGTKAKSYESYWLEKSTEIDFPAAIEVPWGCVEQKFGGYLDTRGYLEDSRVFFEKKGLWRRAIIEEEELREKMGGVVWNGMLFSAAVVCVGWMMEKWKGFDDLIFNSAKGSILSWNQSAVDWQNTIWSCGLWVLPTAEGGLRAGATYEFEWKETDTYDENKVQLLRDGLKKLGVVEEADKIDTAIRPVLDEGEAVIGALPRMPWLHAINGLGSKGVLRAPWLTQHWLEYFINEIKLDEEVDRMNRK